MTNTDEPRLTASRNEIEAANLLVERGFAAQACTHAYYGAFYTAREALARVGTSPETHSGTIQAFAQLIVAEGLDTEAGRLVASLATLREETVCQFAEPSEKRAKEAIHQAQQVINVVDEFLSVDRGQAGR